MSEKKEMKKLIFPAIAVGGMVLGMVGDAEAANHGTWYFSGDSTKGSLVTAPAGGSGTPVISGITALPDGSLMTGGGSSVAIGTSGAILGGVVALGKTLTVTFPEGSSDAYLPQTIIATKNLDIFYSGGSTAVGLSGSTVIHFTNGAKRCNFWVNETLPRVAPTSAPLAGRYIQPTGSEAGATSPAVAVASVAPHVKKTHKGNQYRLHTVIMGEP